VLKRIVFISLLLVVLLSAGFGQGERQRPKPLTRILFVFDASQSMYGRWQSDTKFSIASRLFINILDSLKNIQNLQIALRVYGH
jgi:Ca-activated chloride channel family protein